MMLGNASLSLRTYIKVMILIVLSGVQHLEGAHGSFHLTAEGERTTKGHRLAFIEWMCCCTV